MTFKDKSDRSANIPLLFYKTQFFKLYKEINYVLRHIQNIQIFSMGVTLDFLVLNLVVHKAKTKLYRVKRHNNVRCALPVMKRLIMQFSRASYFSPS